ncbi:arsenical efflux pump membrane protein ArsB [Acidiferrobacter sp. SPIII_3]|nr:arsenical efflux pump membrane protein ArsB [Acidiferrobacter sp. SPIII_3]
MVLAVAVFVFTLFLVIVQPRGLGIGWGATIGAVVALALGVVHVQNIPAVWDIVWNATLTFVGLIIISLLLDEAGFFHWAALHMARAGGGRGRRLFPLIILLGTLVAAFFANDGAALILTPIVLAMLVALGFSPVAALAFVMGTGFIADTTSLPLVISNLVNIVSADFFAIPFRRYAMVMVPVDIVAGLATFAMLWLYFRRDIPRTYDVSRLEAPATAIKDPLLFRLSWPVLALLLGSYFLAGRLRVPVSLLTGLAASILLLVAARVWRAGRGAVVPVARVLREAPWQIVVFSLGMYLVVYGLRDAGLTAWLARLLQGFAAPRGPVADRRVQSRHVSRRLWSARCRAHGMARATASRVRGPRAHDGDHRDRFCDRHPVGDHEQYADRTRGFACHPRCRCRSGGHARGDDLRQCGRL